MYRYIPTLAWLLINEITVFLVLG